MLFQYTITFARNFFKLKRISLLLTGNYVQHITSFVVCQRFTIPIGAQAGFVVTWCLPLPCVGRCRWLTSALRQHPAACRHAQLPHRKRRSLRHVFGSGLGGRRRLPRYASTRSAGRSPLECRRPLAHPRQGIRTWWKWGALEEKVRTAILAGRAAIHVYRWLKQVIRHRDHVSESSESSYSHQDKKDKKGHTHLGNRRSESSRRAPCPSESRSTHL